MGSLLKAIPAYTPEDSQQLPDWVDPCIFLLRLPILGNPDGCLYEKVNTTEKTLEAHLHDLLLRYGEIVPKSGFAEIWEILEGASVTHDELPDFRIEFSPGATPGVKQFKRLDD